MTDFLLVSLRVALLGLCVWALLKGGGPERTGGAILLAAYLCKLLLNTLGFPLTYAEPNLAHLVLGAILFLASLPLAIRSNRVWPLAFAALYLVQLTGHFSVLTLSEGRILAYWILIQIPVIAQAGVLAWGTYTFLQRERRGIRASDWRLKVYP